MTFLTRRSKKNIAKPSVKSRSPVDICLSKISSHTRLDTAYREKVYGAILRRSTTILSNAEKESDFHIEFLNQFERMLKKRRGLTIPVGIDAQNTQRYRDISTLVLSLIYFVKVLTKENLNNAIQVEHEGVVYSFSFYQDYIYKSFVRIGIVRNKDSMVITKDVEQSLRVSILEDLLMNSPLTMQWFGMFPDMKRILYRSLQNVDDSIFSMVSDEFINALYSKVTKQETGNTNQAEHRSMAPDKTFIPPDNTTAKENVETRKVIKRSSKLEALVGKAQGTGSSKATPVLVSAEEPKVFIENSTNKIPPKPKIELAVSPAMKALIGRSKQSPTEIVNDEVEIDFSLIGKDCIRLILSKTALISIASLVNKDGEVEYECCLCVPIEVWRDVVKKRILAITDKKVWKKVDSALILEGVLITSNKGLSALQSGSESFVAFDVSKLTVNIQDDIKLLDKTLELVPVDELTHKNI